MRTEIVRTIEEAGQTLALRRRGDAWDVVLGNVVLLSSAALETERAFGRMVADIVDVATLPRRILVGGLGFGATVRGVLEVSGPDSEVVVVEKLAAIGALVRGELAHLAGDVLSDPRVRLVHDDVAASIAGERGLDAILLDVDNGPEWASFRTNARLYAPAALAEAREALVPGGAYAVWSGYRADAFLGKLRAAGLAPRIVELRERGVVRARAYVGTKAPGVWP
jgi:spermidine synthase